MEIGEQLAAASPADFADWLARHGSDARDIWVVLYKKGSAKRTVTYEELIVVALRYGWIDGTRKTLDADSYVQRFSPRRKGSNWNEANRQIARRLIASGEMTPAGHAALPPDFAEWASGTGGPEDEREDGEDGSVGLPDALASEHRASVATPLPRTGLYGRW